MTYGHLRADCLYTGISSAGPTLGVEYGKPLPLPVYIQRQRCGYSETYARKKLPTTYMMVTVVCVLCVVFVCANCRYKVEGVVDADPETVFSYIDPTPASPRAKWDRAIRELHIIEQLEKAIQHPYTIPS